MKNLGILKVDPICERVFYNFMGDGFDSVAYEDLTGERNRRMIDAYCYSDRETGLGFFYLF